MKLGVLIGEERNLSEALDIVKIAETRGYDSVWFGEHVGVRDALVLMGMASVITSRIKIGSCAINAYTRNVGTVVAAVNTISWAAPGRVMLGIANGEEVLSNFGIRQELPLRKMKEFITALRLLLTGEQIHFVGSHVNLHNARAERQLDIPLFIAATGMKMLSLGAKLADGVILNFLTNMNYLEKAHSILGNKQTFQLIAVSINRDGGDRDARWLISKFLFLAPDFFKSIGIGEDTVEKVRSIIKAWPPKREELELAEREIPDKVMNQLVA
ncbi:MAG: LLM class flavin-dependent oxidoreductase [Nitrososphaeria archaeon]